MAIDDPNINIGLKELAVLMFRHGPYLIKPNVFLAVEYYLASGYDL